MAKRKNKKHQVKLSRGKPIDPILLKARNLRASLLRRINPLLKETTPTIFQLHKWLSLPEPYICYYCLDSVPLEKLTIDHKTPLHKDGDNSLSNLCRSCASCNTIKGSLLESEFRALLQLVNSWDEKTKIDFLARLKRGHFGFKK